MRLYYCARSHTWLRHCGTRLRIGLTQRGLQDVGDVRHIHAQPPGARVERGGELLRLEWDALTISDADELYHTRWAAVEGETTLASPVAAEVVGTRTVVDEAEWLVELRLRAAALDTTGLLDEAEYRAQLEQAGEGTFGGDGGGHHVYD